MGFLGSAVGADSCSGCGQPLVGSYMTALGGRWHRACLKCNLCGDPLNNGGSGQFAVGQGDGKPYHLECHKLKFHPTCSVCDNYIPASQQGTIEFKENPFWKERYCPRHENDGTSSCCACARLQRQGTSPHFHGLFPPCLGPMIKHPATFFLI